MKIGYIGVNTSLKCKANGQLRATSYTAVRFKKVAASNLSCLKEILAYNLEHGLMFFRISSHTISLASHPVCKVDWRKHFKKELQALGAFIQKHDMRIVMHPGEAVIINSPDEEINERSIAELKYHADFLDAMGLDSTAKIQIHAGGLAGNKTRAISSFIQAVLKLPEGIRKRLVIKNDDTSFSLRDCLIIAQKAEIPMVFDSFHHASLSYGEPLKVALNSVLLTWKKSDGVMMLDYSSQQLGAKKGAHTDTIDLAHFEHFLKGAAGIDFDIMLEIDDKEQSALKALEAVSRKS